MKYMNYKKVISGVIVFIMMCGVFPKFAIAEENEFEYEDNQEQKYVIDENFPFMKNEILQEICKEKPSGWDIRSAGSKFESSRNRYFKVIDNNEFLPVEMIRKFEPLTHGLVTFDFGFKFEADMSESSWVIGSKENDAVKIIRDKGKLNFQLPDGSYADLGDCDVNETYGVRASVDIDNKKCDIYVNGKLKAKDLPFTTPTDYLSQVTIDTGKKAMGKIQLLYVRVHRGYIVNEQMLTGMKNIPEDWKVETDGGYAKGELKESSQKPDIYSMKIDSRGGDVKLTKDFEVQDNKLIYKYKILIPKAIDGVKISLASGADNAISVTTNGSEFVSIDGGGNEKNIYKYVPNVWYHFKWEIDLNTNLATININGRKAIEDVPIASNGSIDNIKVLAKQNSITEIFLDDFLLTKKYDEPSDYVPEPKKVESENTLNGMQMCSLWRDGNHIGWDWINNTPERKPYMGYYDEGSPEVADWEIKWMLEHGINFQMYCWYNIVADSDQPLKDPAMGWAIHDGLFDAKYRDQMDYMILWENAPHKAKNTLEHFKNNLVPFWIEHYLKDENYLKVDNRPIFGIYEYGQFLNDVGGKEKAKEALEYFTNECNKAGVGEPFFITSSSGNNDEVAVGFDYIYQYTYQMGSWIPDKQKDSMISYSKKDPKLGVIPSICMGRDDSPWGMGPGNFVEPEKYKELISWVKEDLTPTLPKIASKPINMFTTWNEYGEGHFICPTEMTGFSYLDAIREAYIGDGEHQDIRPTKNQLDRIDNLYDSERKVKPLKRNPKPEKTPTNVVKGWYFDKDGDTEGWSANGIIKNYKALDGKISGEVTGWDPVLFSPSLGEFDASTVSQVKIRMKNGTSDCAGEFYYITKKYDGYTETKGINFEIVPNDNEFRDYYVDIYRSPYWREEDKVTQIRIDPTQWSESGKFEIESIELLGEPKEPDNSIGVFVDGDKKVCETKPFIVDGVTYAPLTNVGSYLSCETDWEEKTGTISAVRGDKTLQFKEGSNSVLINGNEIQIKQAPIVKDGTTYVSIRFIAETLGLDADWNDEENSILIRTPEYMKKEAEKEQPEKKRKLLYAIEFDNDGDMEGGRIGGDYSAAKVEGGAFKGTVAGGDPIFYTPDGLDIPAEEIKNISIGVKNSTTGTAMDIFFITNNSGSYAEDKVIYTNVKPQTDDVVKYNINPKKSSMWKDKIRQIRFDVTNKNGNVEIDYIRLEGDTEEEVGNNNNLNVKSMLRDDNQVTWNFNLNTLIDGWIPNKYMGNVVAENGELYATLGGNNAAILTNSELNIPMSSIEKIVVKYQNITNSNKAKMFFTTNKKEDFSDEKSVTFETVSNDSISTRYEIELKNNENSDEILNSLKFEPGYGQGSFKIDYIKIILK